MLSQHSVAFYHAAQHSIAQRSISLALFKRTDNKYVPVHFVSILSFFAPPTLSLGVQETLCPPEMAPVNSTM